jgi:hypothetical protein
MGQARTRRRDAGSIEAGWLTKVVLLIAVVGVAGVDSVSLLSTRLSVQDDAANAAIAGRDSYASSHNVATAYDAARNAATRLHPDVLVPAQTFVVMRDGSVTATAIRTPSTLVAHYLPWVREHLPQRATEHAVPAT